MCLRPNHQVVMGLCAALPALVDMGNDNEGRWWQW